MAKASPLPDDSGDSTSQPAATHSSPLACQIVNKQYFFGLQGDSLRHQISLAGSIGFLLFGYDQGVLGVSFVILPSSCLMIRIANFWTLQGLNASQDFLRQFDYPSSTLLGTINAIYE